MKAAPNYPRVRLETSDGAFVATLPTMPWERYPEMIRWGDRTFVIWQAAHDGMAVYREGFCWEAIFEPDEEGS